MGMMGLNEKIFQCDSEISYERKHQATLHHNISKCDAAVLRGKSRYFRYEEARQYASDNGLTGPKSDNEADVPEKMYVILLDDGRSNLLTQKDEFQALKCIRSGAYLNACPVYKNVCGYAYTSTYYTGAIGSVLTQFYNGFKAFWHLSFASTLCGRCIEVCPVKILLHEILLFNRKRKEEEVGDNLSWSFGMNASGFAFAKRRRLDRLSGRLNRRLAQLGPIILGEHKDIPKLADQSFSELYREINHKL